MKLTGHALWSAGFVVLIALLLVAIFGLSPSVTVTHTPSQRNAQEPSTQPTLVIERAPRRLRGSPPRSVYIAPNIRLSEGHWQGLEVRPLNAVLRQKLHLPDALTGLLVDDVTLVAAASGVVAGDVLEAVDDVMVDSLEALVQASKRVQMRQSAKLTIYRKGQWHPITLTVPDTLGFVQVETAPMILPGEMMSHPYRGPCTECHAIGTTGSFAFDPEEVISPPPPISAKITIPPHKERGPCQACHPVIPAR